MTSFMNATSNKPFWDLTVPEISHWIHALTPGVPNTGGMLFPVAASASAASNKSEEFAAKKAQGELLIRNLMTALSCASSFGSSSNGDNNSKMSPDAKRQKLDHNNNTAVGTGDRYKILDPSFAKSSSSNNNNNNITNENTTELSPGAILSRITLGGLVNGMSGVDGGCVDTLSCIPLIDLQKSEDNNTNSNSNNGTTPSKGIDAVIDTAGNCVLKDLIKLARGLLRSISAR
jgi:hypothetical protein